MGIYHEAYLFRPDDFVESVRAPTNRLLGNWAAGRKQLMSEAIAAFDRSPQVRWLANWYGGWDRDGLLEEQSDPDSPFNTAFWYVLFLYDTLTCRPSPQPGLGRRYGGIEVALARSGVLAADARRAVWGRRFAELLMPMIEQAPVEFQEQMAAEWERLDPCSHGGRAGWLAECDLAELRENIRTLRSKEPVVGDIAAGLDSFEKLLAAAEEAGAGMCMIVSG